MPSYRLGVDIGGTFTDLVLAADDGRVLTHKLSSTPDDYARAIVDGVRVSPGPWRVDREATRELRARLKAERGKAIPARAAAGQA